MDSILKSMPNIKWGWSCMWYSCGFSTNSGAPSFIRIGPVHASLPQHANDASSAANGPWLELRNRLASCTGLQLSCGSNEGVECRFTVGESDVVSRDCSMAPALEGPA